MKNQQAVHVFSDDEVEISITKKRRGPYPAFSAIGRTGKYDFVKVMKDITSKGTLWLLWELWDRVDPETNIAVLFTADLKRGEKENVTSGYRELKDKGLVIRIKQGHYLINPHFIYPVKSNFERVSLGWNNRT